MTRYEKIKKLCKEKGVTITGLERELGFAKGSLSKIDKNKPSYERLEKLSHYFELPMDYFVSDAVPTSGHQTGYYDLETAKAAQEMLDDPDLHALMDAARDARPEYVKSAIQLLKTLKETNPDG